MTDADPDLVDRLIDLAESDPERVLFIELFNGVQESARLTAGQLRDRAAALADALRRDGLNPGDVALLIASPPTEFLIGLFGCMWAGVIAAPIAFPRRPEHLRTRLEPVRKNAGAVAVVAGTPQDNAETAVLEELTQGIVPVIAIDQPVATASAPIAERDIAYLQYTSGSTSDPRGVIVTHDNLVANLEVVRALLDMDAESVNVSWCPLTHDMGLIMGALPSIAFGIPSVLLTPAAFIRRPMAWLRAFDRYRGTHGYSPNFGYDLLVERSTEADRAELDLSCVKVLVNGAEQVRPTTRDHFVATFAVSGLRPEAHCAAYGLAEASVLVSAGRHDEADLRVSVDAAALEQGQIVERPGAGPGAREMLSDGVVGPGYDVRIVDPATGEETAPGCVGELWVRGPSVCPGYWKREDETRAAFGGQLAGDDGGPFLRTGDLAFMQDAQIVICGRSKDLIVIRGRNLYPHDIELTAELAHEAVRSGGSAAFAAEDPQGREALVVVAEVDGDLDRPDVVSAISGAVLQEFELHVLDVLLVEPRGVPKTSSGKKQRSATSRLWRAARGMDVESPASV